MNTIIRFGIDLAKNSFAICGVDLHGKIQLLKTLTRKQVLEFFAQQPGALVAMESGSGAHYWARELAKLGHDARIIDPRRVAPYRSQGRSGKNDLNDAVAICEAAGRPQMRFVPIKSPEQQALLMVHRMRQSCVAQHTRTINQMRGLLAEYGIIAPRGAGTFKQLWPRLRTDHDQTIPALVWLTLDPLYTELAALHLKRLAFDRQIQQFVHSDPRAQRLTRVSGIGVLTASAIVATIGNGHDFKNGRQFAAWLGLTPRQYSTGGKTRLGRITRRGDVYLRTLLVHGARSELRRTAGRDDGKSRWVEHLRETKSWNKTAVALANKHARICWSILAHDTEYQPA